MVRITLKRGNLTRKAVLESPPYPKVGDSVTIPGEGAEWFVTRAEECDKKGTLHIPLAKAEKK